MVQFGVLVDDVNNCMPSDLVKELAAAEYEISYYVALINMDIEEK